MRLLFDVTRTLARQFHHTPTGIDRVEYELIRWLLTAPDPDINVFFVVNTPFGCFEVSRDHMEKTFNRMYLGWSSGPQHANRLNLFGGLLRAFPSLRKVRVRIPYENLRAYLEILMKIVGSGARTVKKITSAERQFGFIYFNSSHALLEKERYFEWTSAKNIRSAFFIHDIIPIDYPEYCKPGAKNEHVARLATVAHCGNIVLTCSAYSQHRMEKVAAQSSEMFPPIVVCPLGNKVLPSTVASDFALPDKPYFLCIGTIEGRKNIYFLLEVWRTIIATGREPIPLLLLIGKRGWNAENVFRILDTSDALKPYVRDMSGISDDGLHALIKGARGVLAPSIVEGYGLPPAEALQLGTPVIASNIDAHREVLGDDAVLLDPTDGPAWRHAITCLIEAGTAAGVSESARLQTFRGRSWAEFASGCFANLRAFDAQPY